MQGGLEEFRPSENLLSAGFAGEASRKGSDAGRPGALWTPPRMPPLDCAIDRPIAEGGDYDDAAGRHSIPDVAAWACSRRI